MGKAGVPLPIQGSYSYVKKKAQYIAIALESPFHRCAAHLDALCELATLHPLAWLWIALLFLAHDSAR